MKCFLVLAVLATALASPLSATAQEHGRPVLGAGQEQGRSGRQAPLSRVLSMLAQRYPGRHLNTTTGEAGGKPAYYVQWQLDNGRVVVFVVDAESGQVVGRQGG